MHASRRRVQLLVGVEQSKLRDRLPRGAVVGMVAGEDCARANDAESVLQRSPGCLGRQSLTPVLRAQMEPELVDAVSQVARPEATATQVLTRRSEEYRPVLHAMVALKGDLLRQPTADPGFIEGTAYEDRHPRVSPEFVGEWQVLWTPEPKIDASSR
jgi:hypothetical protein